MQKTLYKMLRAIRTGATTRCAAEVEAAQRSIRRGLRFPCDQEALGVEHEVKIFTHVVVVILDQVEFDVILGRLQRDEDGD